MKMNTDVDVRDVLPSIHVPTVVMHRTDDRDANVEEGRYIAASNLGARFAEFSGADHSWWTQDRDAILDEVEELATGIRPTPEPNRVLSTVLFTDLVRSTERLRDLGDREWAELLGRQQAAVRRQLELFRGREIDTAGDGFFATFDGPARAIRCALAIRRCGPVCRALSPTAGRGSAGSGGTGDKPRGPARGSRSRARCSLPGG